MGWSLAQVNGLTEYELSLWMVRGPLWPRRMEMMLMQLTNVVAQTAGNKTSMSDFDLFAKKLANAELDMAAQDLADMAGAGVRKLGQGRK